MVIFLLSGCSPLLPDKERNLSDFIPQEEENIEQIICSKEICNFSERHFPDDCSWTQLDRIVDGDTILTTDEVRVRFIGIDTPELKDPRKSIQPFAFEASETLGNLLSESEKICLISDSVGDQIDKYGRTLAYIFTDSGLDINAEMLRVGMAKGYFYFPFERKEEFRIYETQAKRKKVGRWRGLFFADNSIDVCRQFGFQYVKLCCGVSDIFYQSPWKIFGAFT
ncbi:thermonuclease family protein [Candidatus Gracilibacteria bacterium]|nr:thermonuclease family protein [Candidatus Gracilibacteria bacterium]